MYELPIPAKSSSILLILVSYKYKNTKNCSYKLNVTFHSGLEDFPVGVFTSFPTFWPFIFKTDSET